MGNILNFISFFSISLFLLSCNDSTTEVTLTTYNIVGDVTDSNGNALSDVNVYFVYHLTETPANKVSKITEVDTLYQNYPNPFSDSTTIRFETYRNIQYEIKFFEYASLSSTILLQGSSSPGLVECTLGNFNGYANGIYKLNVRYLVNSTTRYQAEMSVIINRTEMDQLTLSKPNIKTLNGQFDINHSMLPLQKIIYCSGETYSSNVTQKQVSDEITFVLTKEGYKSLQADYIIDRYNKNEFTFRMEKN